MSRRNCRKRQPADCPAAEFIIDRRNTAMGMKINAQLPLPADLKAEYPLSENIVKIKGKKNR